MSLSERFRSSLDAQGRAALACLRAPEPAALRGLAEATAAMVRAVEESQRTGEPFAEPESQWLNRALTHLGVDEPSGGVDAARFGLMQATAASPAALRTLMRNERTAVATHVSTVRSARAGLLVELRDAGVEVPGSITAT